MSEEVRNLISHHEREIEELRADPMLAGEYLKLAIASLSRPAERAGALLALRALGEALGGVAAVAERAGVDLDSASQTMLRQNSVF